jgi:hypothetical protein
LDGDFTYPSSGISDNQLRVFNRLGLLNPAIDEASLAGYAQLTSLTDQSASLTNRVRSYLDANCAQCHRPGGTGPGFDARYDTPLSGQNIINGAVLDNLGFDNVHIVTPRDIWRSILYQRANSTNDLIKMPPLARNLVDSNAMAVIAAWINGLPGAPAEAPPTIVPVGGTFPNSVSITLQPPDTNAVLFYTLDGSLPTTNSLRYSSPFLLTASAQISANAFETGFINSVATTAQFTILTNLLFSSPSYSGSAGFQASFTATVSNSYVLLASTDLVHWVPVATNVPALSPFIWFDSGATNYPARFYRVLQQ